MQTKLNEVSENDVVGLTSKDVDTFVVAAAIVVVLKAAIGHQGVTTTLFGRLCALTMQFLGCCLRLTCRVRTTAMAGCKHTLALDTWCGEGMSDVLRLRRPCFQELVADLSPTNGGLLRGGPELILGLGGVHGKNDEGGRGLNVESRS